MNKNSIDFIIDFINFNNKNIKIYKQNKNKKLTPLSKIQLNLNNKLLQNEINKFPYAHPKQYQKIFNKLNNKSRKYFLDLYKESDIIINIDNELFFIKFNNLDEYLRFYGFRVINEIEYLIFFILYFFLYFNNLLNQQNKNKFKKMMLCYQKVFKAFVNAHYT